MTHIDFSSKLLLDKIILHKQNHHNEKVIVRFRRSFMCVFA
jgi:hypothetical protein